YDRRRQNWNGVLQALFKSTWSQSLKKTERSFGAQVPDRGRASCCQSGRFSAVAYIPGRWKRSQMVDPGCHPLWAFGCWIKCLYTTLNKLNKCTKIRQLCSLAPTRRTDSTKKRSRKSNDSFPSTRVARSFW